MMNRYQKETVESTNVATRQHKAKIYEYPRPNSASEDKDKKKY